MTPRTGTSSPTPSSAAIAENLLALRSSRLVARTGELAGADQSPGDRRGAVAAGNPDRAAIQKISEQFAKKLQAQVRTAELILGLAISRRAVFRTTTGRAKST